MMNLRNMTGIYIFHEDKVLLIKKIQSKIFSSPDTVLWCPIGGHLENEELNTPERCVIRELFEETSLKEADIGNLTLKYITLRKKDNEIRQQYIYFAHLINSDAVLRECDEGELHWIQIDSIFDLEMSVSNTQCMQHYFHTGRNDDFIYTATAKVDENNALQVVFTPLKDFYTMY